MKQALALAALLIPSFAFSQEVVFTILPTDAEFTAGIERTVASFKPADAFSAAAECGVVDARFLKPVPIEQAERMLGECLAAVATKYGGADLAARRGTVTREEAFTAQVEVLMIMIPKSVGQGTALYRDLSHGLASRQGRLLGHKAVLERADDRTVQALNKGTPAQDALDGCLMPTVLRKIESGEDFIKHYGGCLRGAKSLRLVDIRQSPAHKLGVIVLSEAEGSVVSAMTGPVKVVAANGPVEVQLVAYSNPVYLP